MHNALENQRQTRPRRRGRAAVLALTAVESYRLTGGRSGCYNVIVSLQCHDVVTKAAGVIEECTFPPHSLGHIS